MPDIPQERSGRGSLVFLVGLGLSISGERICFWNTPLTYPCCLWSPWDLHSLWVIRDQLILNHIDTHHANSSDSSPWQVFLLGQ